MRLWSCRLAWVAALALALPAGARAQFMTGGNLKVIGMIPSGGGPQTITSVDEDARFTAYVSIGQNTGTEMSGGRFNLVSGLLDIPSARPDFARLHAFPVPFRPSLGHDRITFRGVTTNTTIRVYTLSGWLVRTLSKRDQAGDPATSQDIIWWPVVNSAGQPLGSGVYPYFAEGDNNSRKSGKLMVIK